MSRLAPSLGLLFRSLHPCPPGPKSAGYLTPGCLATAVPGRGVGVRPEAALTREWRHGGRRLQGDVGFGEGRPRWARLLRQREARALEGTRAATVRAGEKSVSRRQTTSLRPVGPGSSNSHPWSGQSSDCTANSLPSLPDSAPPVYPSPLLPSFSPKLSPHCLTITLDTLPPLYLCSCHLSCLRCRFF